MFKTLKGKLTVVYLFLVLMIGILGITSVFSFYVLSKSIDGLMTDNYDSIRCVSNMLNALEGQNISIVNSIHDNKDSLSNYYENSNLFYKWFHEESKNITETGEKEYIDKIEKEYLSYMEMFSLLQNDKHTNGETSAEEYYKINLLPQYNKIKIELKAVASLNEKAMFSSKDKVTKNTLTTMYMILLLFSIAIIGGLNASRFYINKFLKPIYLLEETLKSVKEGDLNQVAPVVYDDEIGHLAGEFNNMTKRLAEYENSTKGKLLAEKNKSIAIVKSISDPLIVLDENYKIVLLNNACEGVFNIKEAEVLNKHFWEAIREVEIYDFIVNTANSSNEGYREKMVFLQNNEKDYYFNIFINIVEDFNNNTNGLVVLFQNITQLKLLEKVKTDFMATISHELKTPLTSITMGVSLLEDENVGELNDRQKRVIESIKDGGEKLSMLINNLLQLSKIKSDKAVFNFELCSIDNIIENCIKSFNNQVLENDINLHYEKNQVIPMISIDSEKITWVINNLVSNALKHTTLGDEILLTAEVRGQDIFICVKDTGSGIPPEHLGKIFERFVQLNEFDSETEGIGLGLSIAKDIVEAHNGRIWCESKPNQGSSFIFTLPLNE